MSAGKVVLMNHDGICNIILIDSRSHQNIVLIVYIEIGVVYT